jgi:carbon monoxide dehydrogenase subunit G
MPTAEHSRIVSAPLPDVWTFVRDMDNWAPLVTGYERHEKLSDSDSFWFLKGELGGLTRIAEFKVHIDEWDEAGRVLFSLQGVNEPVTGSGSFRAVALAPAETDTPPAAPKPGHWPRWRAAILRFLLGRAFKRMAAAATTANLDRADRARSEITFKLALTAGGRAGLVLNVLLAPMMQPVAADLADRIALAIDGRRAAS